MPNKQTKEEEIGTLPHKEFQIMIVKMVQNLESKLKLQMNSLGDQEDARKVYQRPRRNKKEPVYNE